MRKIAFLVGAVILFSMVGCSPESVSYVGVNAEIAEINKVAKGMIVKGLDENSILGEECFLNCENENITFIFANNNTGQTIGLVFDDFIVGDKIAVNVKSVENRSATPSQVQLLTQRK